MKKAAALPQYSGMKPFSQPTGVVDVQLDKTTNRLATPACPDDYVAAFVAGTEPRETCDQQGGVAGFFSRVFGLGGTKVLPPPTSQAATQQEADSSKDDSSKKKKGIFGKIAGIFRDDKSSAPASKPPADSGDPAPH
jgi:hypothetical protein